MLLAILLKVLSKSISKESQQGVLRFQEKPEMNKSLHGAKNGIAV